MRILNIISVLLSGFILLSCEASDSAYDRGYGDGYAVGYNSICYPNTSNFIHGDFDNSDYSKGYYDGEYDGKADCRAER